LKITKDKKEISTCRATTIHKIEEDVQMNQLIQEGHGKGFIHISIQVEVRAGLDDRLPSRTEGTNESL
jgi:hypothetical protein